MTLNGIKQIIACITMALLVSLVVQQPVSAASTDFKTHKRYLYVQPGQTVHSIVKVLYPDNKEQWPDIIQSIVKKNPHAFKNGVAAQIRVGERLLLPSLKTMSPASSQMVVYKGVEAVGQVISARGKTFAISSKNQRRDLRAGNEIFIGDRLFTGVDGFMRLSMIDDAKIDLRCNSEMLVEDYQLLRAGNRSVIYLLKGSLRKITGSIGKVANDLYEMKTPIATVGVRGTDYAIRVLQSYGCDGSLDVNSDGMFVKVNAGGIDVSNGSGTVGLNDGDAAHISDKNAMPQNIDARDGVFGADDEGSSWWWWLLGILVIVAAA